MRTKDLAPLLQEKYRDGRLCGIERIDDPRFKNIWFVVPPAPPQVLPRKLPFDAIAKANRLLERLPLYESASEVERIVSYLFVRREAVQSSRIEGTFSTIDHVLTPGELYDRDEGKSERASVLGYAHALENEFNSVSKNGTAIFTIELARRLHRQIMHNDPHYRGQPGRLREPGKPGAVVFIGGLRRKEESIYNPAPARHVARCLRECMSWMANEEIVELGDAGMGMTLPVRIAIGHAHFEAIHPFSDGNGRVGRMLLTLQMVCRGILPLYLSGFIEKEKRDYVRGLEQAQKKLRYGPIVEYVCEAMVAAHEEAERTKTLIQELPQQWQKRSVFRQNSAAQRAITFLATQPIFTVSNLREALQVSTPAANRAATQLVEAGIIRERTGFGRNRVFAAEEIVELLSRPFEGDPALALERARDLLRSRATVP